MIPMLPADCFGWQEYRAGIKVWRELGVACRAASIYEQADVLRKHAVGWRSGEHLFCRPKINEVAVLFFIDEEFCWTHLRKEEFENVFTK